MTQDEQILDEIAAKHKDDDAVLACVGEVRRALAAKRPEAEVMVLVKKMGYAVATQVETPVATPLVVAMSQVVH